MASNEAFLRQAIWLLALGAFASASSLRVCDPLLPQLAADFFTTPGDAARTISLFAVSYGVMQLLYGPLGDRYGKFRIISLATLSCAAGSIAAAVAPSLNGLVLARMLTAAAAAGIIPMAMAWIGDCVPYERRQETLARFLTGQIVGMVSGLFLGGLFADTLGWRWVFCLLALVYLAVGLLLLHAMHQNPVIVGSLAVKSLNPGAFWSPLRTVIAMGWARVVLATVFLEGMAVFGALAFVPTYLHASFNISLTMAGSIVVAFGAGGLIYTSLTRQLVARLGERGLAVVGSLLIGAAFITLRLAPHVALGVVACLLAGLGFYMLHNTLQTNATQMAPQVRGTAVSVFASLYFLGQSAGVAAAAVVVDRSSAADLFTIAAIGLPLLGLGFAILLQRHAAYSNAAARVS